MAQPLIDGTSVWAGGMDTSKSPADILEYQYSNGINVMIPESLGGLTVRHGFHHVKIQFKNDAERELYEIGHVQGEGYFTVGGRYVLVVVVNGYVFRLNQIGYAQFKATITNINSPNSRTLSKAWVTRIPEGCIVNNGFDYPLYITETTQRRTDPSKGEIGIGMMGVYVQGIFFYVDQSQRQIIPSDFKNPIKRTEWTLSGLIGFAAPDADEVITAIGKQKTTLNYVEGGNLVFSTNRDIYSVDVRGPRSEWRNLGSSVGKVNETIPSFSACSSYSFEAFNGNIYFRSANYGVANLRQSEFQFTQSDVNSNQAAEASYYLNHDTDWMLHCCYSRKFNNRLFTTVAPERTEDGYIFWNGLLSFNPSESRSEGRTPNRHEGVWTGLRPWCVTSVSRDSQKDILFIHSYDHDGRNRLYMMDGTTNYDINHRGEHVEIEGYVETRAYTYGAAALIKKVTDRVLNLSPMDRTVNLTCFSRPQVRDQWIQFFQHEMKIGRVSPELPFVPVNSQPQPRYLILPTENLGTCFNGNAFAIQYRFEFKGPIHFEWFATQAATEGPKISTTQAEEEDRIIIYNDRKDYTYLLSKT